MNYRIMLIHGFRRTAKDMKPLENNLKSMGYQVETPEFPLTFNKMSFSMDILRKKLLSLKNESAMEEIVLIGYGLGGVLIEKTLQDDEIGAIVDKIILVASPARDSVIRRRLKRMFPLLDKIYKPLRMLKKGKKFIINNPKTEIGVIIGTEPCGIFTKWLGEQSDGVFRASECTLPNAKDTLFLPLIYKEIHKNIGTAKYISEFITKGVFSRQSIVNQQN